MFSTISTNTKISSPTVNDLNPGAERERFGFRDELHLQRTTNLFGMY